MDILTFTDDFFVMEDALDLFSQRIDGVLWWDPVRHDVFYLIYFQLFGAKATQQPKPPLVRRAINLATSKWLNAKINLKLRFRQYDVLAFRAPRFATMSNNTDVILDDILACTPGRKLVIDTFPHYYHVRLLRKSNLALSSSQLCHLNAAVKAHFGQEIDVESLVVLLFSRYRDAVVQYGRLLDRASPKLIVLVQNGIEKALFKAAHDRSIPVVEAQHGLINRAHPAYSYPLTIAAGALETLPTIFLAFAQHWIAQCHYPVPEAIAVGNRHLHVTPKLARTDDVLVICADVYEEVIEEVLRPAAAALSHRRFIYKLHPNQFVRRRMIEQRLSDLPNIEIIAHEETLRQLIQRCGAALCVQSTGAYEVLQAGIPLYILKRMDFRVHFDVFNHPNLHLIDTFSELVQALSATDATDNPAYSDVFFQEFNKDLTLDLMARLLL